MRSVPALAPPLAPLLQRSSGFAARAPDVLPLCASAETLPAAPALPAPPLLLLLPAVPDSPLQPLPPVPEAPPVLALGPLPSRSLDGFACMSAYDDELFDGLSL